MGNSNIQISHPFLLKRNVKSSLGQELRKSNTDYRAQNLTVIHKSGRARLDIQLKFFLMRVVIRCDEETVMGDFSTSFCDRGEEGGRARGGNNKKKMK